MVRYAAPQQLPSRENISVHSSHKSVRDLPSDAVLLSLLKRFETELQRRGMLPNLSQNDFFPLWFLAETERNVALWRMGLSLAYSNEFEFWLSVEGLIQKRLGRLQTEGEENPFTGNFTQDDLRFAHEPSPLEQEYLFQFQALYQELSRDFHALSVATSIAAEELGCEQNPILLLPLAR